VSMAPDYRERGKAAKKKKLPGGSTVNKDPIVREMGSGEIVKTKGKVLGAGYPPKPQVCKGKWE